MRNDAGTLELFLAHRSALIDYATPIVGDRMRAEDVVQEAFVRFAPAAGRADGGPEQPVAYLYRIVRNLALDWARRRAVEHREDGEPPWWILPARPRTPEEETLHRRDLDRIAAVLASLPEETRVAVEMHRFGGYTLQEIGRRLGVSTATAHRLVRDALVRIAGEL